MDCRHISGISPSSRICLKSSVKIGARVNAQFFRSMYGIESGEVEFLFGAFFKLKKKDI
ncbi:unnamed protein product [Meloidogyne enterolobii]|uniref:Uncharacterized protein n=1 Tax=Meloidogyne enterolobii TaxID=390850 RepID=A0ACB0Y6F5_MELEN